MKAEAAKFDMERDEFMNVEGEAEFDVDIMKELRCISYRTRTELCCAVLCCAVLCCAVLYGVVSCRMPLILIVILMLIRTVWCDVNRCLGFVFELKKV